MLSSFLRSDRAIQVNIQIMRTFTKLRHMIAGYEELKKAVDELREQTDEQFEVCSLFWINCWHKEKA